MAEEEVLADEEYLEGEEGLEEDEMEEEGGLAAEIRQQLKSAPWYLTSAAVHMVVLLLLMLIPTMPPKKPRKKVILKTQVIEEVEEEEEEEEPEPEPEEDPLEAVMTETDSVMSPTEVVTETVVETQIQVDTQIEMEVVDEVVGDPSEDEIADASEDAAPSLMGVRGSAFSNRNGLSSGFRGGFGKIGRGIRGMVRGGRGGGMGKGLCLVWLLDQSASMKDDQEKVAAQARDIQDLLTDGGRKKMLSAVVSYGANWTVTQDLTKDSSEITEAILNVEIDKSGTENTMQAVTYVCQEIMAKKRGWTKVLVIMSDESSSDDRMRYATPKDGGENRLDISSRDRRLPLIEVALKALVQTRTRLFVIGKESPFQSDFVREPYIDQEGRRWLLDASRGPESAMLEVPIVNATVNDNVHHRGEFTGNEVLAGFGVYDLAYLAKGSKGAYFILDEQAAAKRPMSPSERARKPFTLDWAIMDLYAPQIVSRMKYKELMLSGNKQSRKVMQLNEYMTQNKGSIARVTRCRPSQVPHYRGTKRSRKQLLVKLIDVIGDARATDEEIFGSEDRRQMGNIDLWYCVLLADQMITDAWLDAFESYRGSLSDQVPEGHGVHCILRPKQGANLSEEEQILFTDRMRRFTEACNDTIRRHANTPWAVCANWMQNGPRKWGRPHELIRVVWKHVHRSHPPRPRM